MNVSQRPNIGVISDCVLQRHVLNGVLDSYGLNVSVSCEPFRLEDVATEKCAQVNCWILELEDESFESDALTQLMEESDSPILFGLGKAPPKNDEAYISWERRLLNKLEEHLGKVEQMESEASIIALDEPSDSLPEVQQVPIHSDKPVARTVCVLAASLGGPAAVKAFLDEMPADIQAGFLYAQHVDAHFSNVLTNVLGRHAKLELRHCVQGDPIREGEVLVVPVDREITFGANGIAIKSTPWPGPYGPSIDQLLWNLHSFYGRHCHVIVFSGMGNDGALSASKMRKNGCAVWTQAPDSCANGSMPQSIIDLECSDYTGHPKALAAAFIKMMHAGHAGNHQ